MCLQCSAPVSRPGFSPEGPRTVRFPVGHQAKAMRSGTRIPPLPVDSLSAPWKPSAELPHKPASGQSIDLGATSAFVATNLTDERISSGLPISQA